MTIADVTAYSLSAPLDPPRKYQFSEGVLEIHKRDVILVVLETTDGEVGVAPCGTGTVNRWEEFSEATHDDIARVINEIVGPKLEGKAIDDIAEIHEVVRNDNLPKYLRWQAVSVIDIAVHDILGKRSGMPIYEMLGFDTDPTPELELYASSGYYLSPEEAAVEASTLVDRGYTGYKFRAGRGVEEDRLTIEHLRRALGPDPKIMVDAHAWWSREGFSYGKGEVRSLIEHMGEYDIYWVEEPVPPNDYQSYRSLRKETGVPLAGGENENTPGSLVNMAELGDVTFLQGDVKQHGGYTGCRDVIEYCLENPITYVPHNYGTHLGIVANAHLAAAAPEVEFVEFPIYETDGSVGMYPFPLAEDVITTDLDVADGTLSLPTDPGLGVDVNFDVIDEFSFVDGPWSGNSSTSYPR
jgi:L-alanine-DL-glutamate epimerase-like enolase superfamily enzyme